MMKFGILLSALTLFALFASSGCKGTYEAGLSSAARKGALDRIEYYLEKGTDINAQWVGFAPLHNASQFGHNDAITLLLDKGAHINAVSKDGKTALEYAEEGAHKETAELLTQKGAKRAADIH